MEKLEAAAEQQSFAVIPAFDPVDKKGIESRRLADALEEINSALDEQAGAIDDWREHVIQLLLKPLVDEEGDETTGEEYEQSTKLQDEILVYLQILRTTLSDRTAVITGQRNFLADHETRMAARLAATGEGAFPEKFLELLKEREAIKPPFEEGDKLGSIRGVVSELRALSAKLRHEAATGSSRATNELAVVSDLLKVALRHQTEQSKTAVGIEKELERFMDTLNSRIDYYRQLQEVSDMVGEYEGSVEAEALEAALVTAQNQEDALLAKLAAAEAKHRYRKSLSRRGSSVRLLTCGSDASQGGGGGLRGATDVCHLPGPLQCWCLDGVRPPVLQGVHHVVVPGPPQLPDLQEALAPVESSRHHAEAAGAEGVLGCTSGRR